MLTLSDKLKSLGVKLGARDLPRPEFNEGPLPQARHDAYTIEQVLPGRFQPTPDGDSYVVETLYTPEYRHGRFGLWATASLRTMAEWAGEPHLAGCESPGLVFLDTETSGLAGGTGTYAFLIGVGRFHGDHFHLAQFFMRDPAEEPAQLAALTGFLQPCDALVTFNGKSFDVPLLNTRYTVHGRATPLASPGQLDLLHLARRLWRDRLPSRALGQLEIHILGAHRPHEDVPGWLIPSLYFDYLRSGDARPLKGVFYHNAMDVLAMAALLTHMAQLLADPLDTAIEHGLDVVALGKLFEDLGRLEAAIQLYERGLAYNNLPEDSYWDTQRRLSLAQRRRGDLAAALDTWRLAAEGRQIYAHVELAKYYEHQARDYSEAARWTQAALDLVNTPDFPRYERRQWLADLQHRLARLQRKLGHGAG
ncbi:MAG: ribonuclease H-like domain-containing protein [Chloroflexi bacterium]|nr:ribonuclease H-like domain-containing protein [Chloroflexota bacterium]